jgi:NUMOD1 domain
MKVSCLFLRPSVTFTSYFLLLLFLFLRCRHVSSFTSTSSTSCRRRRIGIRSASGTCRPFIVNNINNKFQKQKQQQIRSFYYRRHGFINTNENFFCFSLFGKAIPVEQVDLVTGEVVNTFSSATEASKSLGTDLSGICHALAGRRNSCKGYFWRRVGEDDDDNGNTELPKKWRTSARIPVEQVDIGTGTIINTFPTMAEAARSVNGSIDCISNVVHGVQLKNSYRGYFWRRVGDTTPPKKSWKGPRPVQQICLESGNVLATYPSLAAAAKAVGVIPSSIARAANGRDSYSFTGYAWRLVEDET